MSAYLASDNSKQDKPIECLFLDLIYATDIGNMHKSYLQTLYIYVIEYVSDI